MTTLTSDRLAELAADVLERTAFMMAEPVSVESPKFAAATCGATINYTGPEEGTIVIRSTESFIRSLAASLLGVEPDSVEIQQHGPDVLKELANIVGGSVIADLGGTECTYSLGLPRRATPAEVSRNQPPDLPACTSCLDCEGQLLFVTWFPGVCASTAQVA